MPQHARSLQDPETVLNRYLAGRVFATCLNPFTLGLAAVYWCLIALGVVSVL